MSSVLHPIGPEEPRTYWVRRVLVIALAVIVLAVFVWVLWPREGRTAGTATPQSSDSPSPSDSAGVTGSPSATDSPSPTTSTTASTSSTSSNSSTADASGTPGATTSSASSTASAPSSSSSSASSTSSTTATPSVTGCDPEQMRVTLTGPRTVRADKKVTFRLSVINGSPGTCTLAVSAKTVEVKIYSGTDRIWSTNDCGRWLGASASGKLAAEKAYEWTTTWTGQRSTSDCTLTGGLRPGTYVATAQLSVDGHEAEPVQLVMRLR